MFHGESSLASSTGIQQGDPFGPALFSLGIDEVTREIDTELNVWYLDDGTLGDPPMKVASNVERLVTKMREIGLEFKGRKCQLTMLRHSREEAGRTEDLFRALIPEIEIVPESRATLLGAPLAEGGLSGAVRRKREDLERLVSRLELIESHQAFVLLKNCFAIPKLQYILRASSAYKQIDDLSEFDRSLLAWTANLSRRLHCRWA